MKLCCHLISLIETRVAEALANQEQLRNNGVNGDGSQNLRSGTERPTCTPRECTYKDFLNCRPLNFKGTEGVVVLSQWFEKMESVFHISNCAPENQALKKMTTVKYCPRGEIKKLEIEIWNLKVKGTDITSYTLRFQELALMCGRMFPEESDEVEKYVTMGGKQLCMPMSNGSKSLYYSERQAEQEGKVGVNAGTIRVQVSPPWPMHCKVRELQESRPFDEGCWNPTMLTIKGPFTSIECGNQGHYKSDCPELENQNHGNQVEGTEARGMVYALGGGETNQDLDNIEDDINA
ncbi:hypothetical protein Tco_0246191 [Tanacetum coccineum]